MGFNPIKNLDTENEVSVAFYSTLVDFIHYSGTLIHLYVRWKSISKETMEYVVKHGLKKSRTLLSFHTSGLAFGELNEN